MKVSGIVFALLMIASMSVGSFAAEKNYKKILGLWEFTAPDAPQRYASGTLALRDIDQHLAGEFTVQGQPLAIPRISFEKDTLSLGFEVENTSITLKMKFSNGSLTGTAQTPDGPVKVTAKPLKTEAK